MTRRTMLTLLKAARYEIWKDYYHAGGDEEAKGNPNLRAKGRLLDRLDKALTISRSASPGHRGAK